MLLFWNYPHIKKKTLLETRSYTNPYSGVLRGVIQSSYLRKTSRWHARSHVNGLLWVYHRDKITFAIMVQLEKFKVAKKSGKSHGIWVGKGFLTMWPVLHTLYIFVLLYVQFWLLWLLLSHIVNNRRNAIKLCLPIIKVVRRGIGNSGCLLHR